MHKIASLFVAGVAPAPGGSHFSLLGAKLAPVHSARQCGRQERRKDIAEERQDQRK